MEKISNINQEKNRLSQEKMKEFLEHQIQLAKEIYEIEVGFPRPGSPEDEDLGNKIMTHWSENGYSNLYIDIIDNEDFLKNPKYNGEISKLSVNDLILEKNKKQNS